MSPGGHTKPKTVKVERKGKERSKGTGGPPTQNRLIQSPVCAAMLPHPLPQPPAPSPPNQEEAKGVSKEEGEGNPPHQQQREATAVIERGGGRKTGRRRKNVVLWLFGWLACVLFLSLACALLLDSLSVFLLLFLFSLSYGRKGGGDTSCLSVVFWLPLLSCVSFFISKGTLPFALPCTPPTHPPTLLVELASPFLLLPPKNSLGKGANTKVTRATHIHPPTHPPTHPFLLFCVCVYVWKRDSSSSSPSSSREGEIYKTNG